MTTTEIRYGQVNHERVRRAMAEVGARLEAERRERVAVDHAEIIARGGHICEDVDRRTGQPCEWGACLRVNGRWVCEHHVPEQGAGRRSPHDYGPHRPEDAPTSVEIWIGRRPPRPVLAAIHPDLLRQREQMNAIAHAQAIATRGGNA